MEYASRAVGNAGLTTGIIGTALGALIGCIQGQVAQLQQMTQMVIPNSSVMPGWGPVEITAAGGTVKTAASGTNG